LKGNFIEVCIEYFDKAIYTRNKKVYLKETHTIIKIRENELIIKKASKYISAGPQNEF
jgi:hypothetical protein